MRRPGVIVLLVLFVSALHAQVDMQATRAFLQRMVRDQVGRFEIREIPAVAGRDVFELDRHGDRIVLRGSNGLSVASALNLYLRTYCRVLPGWNDPYPVLPAKLPLPEKKLRRTTPYTYRYYLNYCTFNYTMSWWQWDRWQQEIDWMSLNGINMPLAITGEEAIWQKLYLSMGLSERDLEGFFSGPAYFSWFWMGNLDAWGGPLPQHWKDSHLALQHQILKAERAMGMKPVLPAFTGHVPASFPKLFPAARVKKTNWGAGFPDVYILEPGDSIFDIVGKKFLTEEQKEFGTDHLYSADTFNENLPPTDDSLYLSDVSKKVFSSMTAADPKAIWVMQGWMFHYQSDYWRTPQIKALLNAIPNDHMILLDLYSESHPLWKKTEAYYGKPWIWNMLHNFGGNISLWGRMQSVASDPAEALHDAASGKMTGIGLAPEGIEQNPALYQLMIDNVWRSDTIALQPWLRGYAHARYGKDNADMVQAWTILGSTVYRGGLGEGGPESIIVSRPTLDVFGDRVRTKLDYRPADLAKAWDLFVNASPELKNNTGFQYDLVDLTRQMLANYATPVHQQIVLAYLQHDTAAFDEQVGLFLQLMDDMDRLLLTRKEFLLGGWIASARVNGITDEEKNLYERNARNLVTLWGDKESGLHEYSNRQWSGLIADFYRPRWSKYFVYLRDKMLSGARMEMTDFDRDIKNSEWNWVNARDKSYPAVPSGDAVLTAVNLYGKYRSKIK